MSEPGPTQRAVLQMITPPPNRTGSATAGAAGDADPEPLSVRIDGAAKMMSLHRATVYGLIQSGELPSLKVGKYRLVRVEAIKTYLRNLEFRQQQKRLQK